MPSILTESMAGLAPAMEMPPLESVWTPGWVVNVEMTLVEPEALEESPTGRSTSSRADLVSAIFETSVLMGASVAATTFTVSVCEESANCASTRATCRAVRTTL
jgi:hypothetical protein